MNSSCPRIQLIAELIRLRSVRPHRIRQFAATSCLAFGLLATAASSQAEDPQVPPIATVTGSVTTLQDGAPIASGGIRIYNYSTQSYSWRAFDGPGHYTVDLTPGTQYTIWPCYFPDTNPLGEYIKSNSHTFVCPEGTAVKDFQVKPAVLVTLDSLEPLSPSVEGSYVCWPPYWPVVGTFHRGGSTKVFYPDEVPHGINPPMPYAGHLVLAGNHSFTEYYPQSAGQLMQYSCSGKFVDEDTPQINFQRLVPRGEVAADCSWNDPGGLGWSAFPRTPDDRLPNNPDVRVEVRYGMSMPNQIYPRGWIRMNGVISSQDLTLANDYTAVFTFPIPECGPLELQGEYLLPLQNYQNEWRPLAAHFRTSASNGDLTGDGLAINLSDVQKFSTTYGLCPSDNGYLQCANYSANEDPASDCIDVADLSAFASIIQFPAKSRFDVDGIDGTLSFHQLESGALQLVINASAPWTACVAQFTLASTSAGDFVWTPTADALDRSVVLSHGAGDAAIGTLMAIGPFGSGTTVLGELSESHKARLAAPHLMELGIAGIRGDAEHPPTEARAQLAEIRPNPFNPKVTISFDLPHAQSVSLVVFDLAGRTVRTLLHMSEQPAGHHSIRWDGSDDSGRIAAAGVYFCRLEAEGANDTRRLTLLK